MRVKAFVRFQSASTFFPEEDLTYTMREVVPVPGSPYDSVLLEVPDDTASFIKFCDHFGRFEVGAARFDGFDELHFHPDYD